MSEAENYLQEALEAYNSNDFKQAVSLASKAIEQGVNNKAVYQIRGYSYYNLYEYKQALSDFNLYLQAAPDDYAMRLQRGITYSLLEQPEKGIPDMDAFIAANPHNSAGYQNRGYTYVVMKRNEEGIADLTKAFELGTTSPHAYYQRGVAYFNLKNYEKAYPDFSKAIEGLPEQTDSIYLRGLISYFKRDYKSAIEDMSRLIFLDENHPYGRFYRMLAYRDSGNMTEAQYDADQLVKTGKTPITFATDGIALPLVSMEVIDGGFNMGLDTSPLGSSEQPSREAWLKANGNKPRVLPGVDITFSLPQGGIPGFKGHVFEAKW